MKIYLLLFLILAFTSNPIGNENNNEFSKGKRKRQFNLDLYECIVKSETASNELKKYAEEHKDKGLRQNLHSIKSKLNENDLNILKQCRKETFLKFRETIQKTFEEISRGFK